MTNEREKIIGAIEGWQKNRLTSFTPRDILYDFGDQIIAALRTPTDGEAHAEIQRLQDAKRRALALADERAKENVALILAAQAVVHDYPVAAGTAKWDTEGGYGSIRDLRLTLDTLSTAHKPADTPDEGPDPLGYAKGEKA